MCHKTQSKHLSKNLGAIFIPKKEAKMKRKITIITLTALAIAGAFLLGRNMPSKYNYLDLNKVSETQITDNEIVVYTTTGDYYTLKKGE